MMGFLTFLAGLWGVLILIFEEVGKTERVPFRYYAIMVGLISGGLAMIGIGQGLRLLLLIVGKPHDYGGLARGLLRFTSRATIVAFGTSSCGSPKVFGPRSAMKKLLPVMLPPGRLMLATNPALTGSLPLVKTIGMVAVAAPCAAQRM